ncbi:MAG: alpha/beta hydrolase-fold protein [Bacteroidota bacterium]
MKKIIYIPLFLLLAVATNAQAPLPKASSGTIDRIENFPSQYVTQRNIDVWLPEGYSDEKKYPVLYMHDGQMLYDPDKSWNQQAWNIDDVATTLFQSRTIEEFIVVGIWNGGSTRHPDYFPQQPFESLSEEGKDTVTAQLQKASINSPTGVFQPQSDRYLQFLVEEVKPYIDQHYSVHTNREHTYVMGSSMGGLISLYAICEYPQVFGGAACLSTHWPGTFTLDNNPIPQSFLHYLETHLPTPHDHKIYFDCGDQTLDRLYPDIQKKADQIMAKKGYDTSNWSTRFFPGEDHSENAWSKRVHVPLTFLFGR